MSRVQLWDFRSSPPGGTWTDFDCNILWILNFNHTLNSLGGELNVLQPKISRGSARTLTSILWALLNKKKLWNPRLLCYMYPHLRLSTYWIICTVLTGCIHMRQESSRFPSSKKSLNQLIWLLEMSLAQVLITISSIWLYKWTRNGKKEPYQCNVKGSISKEKAN